MSKEASIQQEKSMQKLFKGKKIWRLFNTRFIDEHVRVIRECVVNFFF